MTKNYMKKMASMFGLELEEEFDIMYDGSICRYSPYKFTRDGLIDRFNIKDDSYLNKLLISNNYTIQKRPWVPKIEEEYYLVVIDGSIGCYTFRGDTIDLGNLSMGNCFQTEADAITGKGKVLSKFEELRKMV